ncbi:MAG: sugar phosphate nucleotidyltransferase [bacterium]
MDPKLAEIDVLILTGGQGTRLRSVVSDRPKPMADIQGQPFLEILLEYLLGQGLKRFILSTGFMSYYIEDHFAKRPHYGDIIISRETSPLGTAGAIKHAKEFIRSEPFIVLNGDSFCEVSYNRLIQLHIHRKALTTLVVAEAGDQAECGSVVLDYDNSVRIFDEKQKDMSCNYLSAGIYCMSQAMFNVLPEDKMYSLEYDIFPRLIQQGCYAYITPEPFFDIGEEVRYKYFKTYVRTKTPIIQET